MLPFLSRAVKLLTSLSVFIATPVPVAFARVAQTPDWNLKELRRLWPALDEFARAQPAPDPDGLWSASELDQDPWFMRGQRFVTGLNHADPDRVAFATESGRLRVQPAGEDRALEIDQPLAPLFELENFLFLRATDPALFRGHLADDDASEGLFFIDQKLLYDELHRRSGPRPVPVFFLPLAGAWTGRVEHVFDRSTETLALNNGAGHSATLGLDTLRGIARVLSTHVTLALLTALKHDPTTFEDARRAVRSGVLELPRVLPARGATFAFGTIFTGIDLDQPERGLVRARSAFAFIDQLVPRAHAGPTPDVLDSLLKTVMMLGSVWMLGTFAQVTVLKDRLRERRRVIEAKRGAPPATTAVARAKRAVVENLDVFMTSLTVLGNGIQVSGGYVLEYLADRSGVKAAQSGWLRKLLENTFLYGRDQAEGITTGARPGLLSITVTGGVDLASVPLSLMYLSPFIFPPIAGLVSPELRADVAQKFSGVDQTGNNLIAGEIMFNVQGLPQYAWAYAYYQRRGLMEVVRPEVQRAFIRSGKNPLEAAHADAVKDEINRRVDALMVERALPSRDEFLFSAPSIVRSFAGALGYDVPPEDAIQSASFNPERAPRFGLAEARWGLTRFALKRALQRNLEMQEIFPGDVSITEAGVILSEMNRRLFTLTAMAKDPLNAGRRWREGKQVRKILTLLSLKDEVAGVGLPFIDRWVPEDPRPIERLITIEAEVARAAGAAARNKGLVRKLLRARVARDEPGLLATLDHADWRRVSLVDRLAEVRAEGEHGLLGAAVRNDRAAALAGRAFRQQLLLMTSGRDDRPKFGDVAVFIAEARREAFARLKAAPPRVGFSDVDVTIEALEIVKAKVAERARRENERTWRPRRGDWLERHQLARAHAAAERAIGFDLATEDPVKQAIYRETFRVKLSRLVGLKTYETPELEAEHLVTRTAREAAENEINDEMANNVNWREYLADRTPGERLRFVAHHYADTFLSKYTELTVSKSSLIPLTSPGQPGFFQAARQTEFARAGTFLGRMTTYALRVGDSFFDSTANKPGLRNWINRRVPLAQDIISDTDLRTRGLIPFLSISWAVNYYLWGVHFNLPTVLWFFVTGGFTDVAHWWVDRALMNVGVPPLEGVVSQLKYATLLTTVTYFTMIPFFFFVGDFERAFNATKAACAGWLTKLRPGR